MPPDFFPLRLSLRHPRGSRSTGPSPLSLPLAARCPLAAPAEALTSKSAHFMGNAAFRLRRASPRVPRYLPSLVAPVSTLLPSFHLSSSRSHGSPHDAPQAQRRGPRDAHPGRGLDATGGHFRLAAHREVVPSEGRRDACEGTLVGSAPTPSTLEPRKRRAALRALGSHGDSQHKAEVSLGRCAALALTRNVS